MYGQLTPTGFQTGALTTGQDGYSGTELLAAGGIGGLLLSIGALFLAYHVFFKPRLSATYAARTALSAKEKEKMKTLELENQELSEIVDKLVCVARGVGNRTGTVCR